MYIKGFCQGFFRPGAGAIGAKPLEPEETMKPMRKLDSWREDEWTHEIYDDVYSLETREEGLENDGLADWEAAFMDGWDRAA